MTEEENNQLKLREKLDGQMKSAKPPQNDGQQNMKAKNNGPCELCRRTTKRGTTEHHLIPRTCHKNKWFQKNFSREEMNRTVSLCRECHAEIHRQIPSEKKLGKEWNTLEKLLDHPRISAFVEWVSKQK